MKILITGITGMIGSEFARQAREKGYEVVGIARSSASSRLAAVPDPSVIACDILDREALRDVLRSTKPDIIAHFAAQAFNGLSWKMEDVTHMTNYIGTTNVLRAARDVVPGAKILLACSSAEYGIVPEHKQPIKEDYPLRPLTPYGVSKVGVENLGYQYLVNYHSSIYLPRLFIHVGTGHPPATLIQNIARQMALIKKGKLESKIHVGRLDTARDFIDVRDGVTAMLLLLECGVPGEPINIGTGTAYTGQQVFDLFSKISGVTPELCVDHTLIRPLDETLLLADTTKIKKLGWEQKYTLEETLTDVFNDWMSRI